MREYSHPQLYANREKEVEKIVYYFLYALFNSTIAKNSADTQLCSDSIYTSIDIVKTIETEYENFAYSDAGQSIKSLVEQVYPATFNCYGAAFSIYEVILDYVNTTTSGTKIAYNLIYNFGNLYDDGTYAYKLFNNIFERRHDWWKRTGYVLGDILYQIFYEPINYEPHHEIPGQLITKG